MDSPTFHIGPNQVQITGKVLHVKLIGPFLVEHARELLALPDRIYREQGMVFLLVDLAESIPPGPEARKLLATWPVAGPYPVVIYGAGVLQRAALQLVLSAMRLLARGSIPEVHVFPTESAARAWIAKHPQGGAAAI
jgi:hypothetical protein